MTNPFEEKVIWNEEAAPREGFIVGVVENFHYKSLHQSIQPIVINVNTGAINYLLVKIEAGANPEDVIAGLEAVHSQFDQLLGLDYQFLDDQIYNQYLAERQAFKVFNLFTVLALVLAALGLLGLAYLIITQRTREIGIRKVMGARAFDILIMENRTFMRAIVLAIVIGLPISYFAMQDWLNAFAFRVPISATPFALTVAILVAVAITSVTVAVMRTVLRNPSSALRYE